MQSCRGQPSAVLDAAGGGVCRPLPFWLHLLLDLAQSGWRACKECITAMQMVQQLPMTAAAASYSMFGDTMA
jgi:hypothetical protein